MNRSLACTLALASACLVTTTAAAEMIAGNEVFIQGVAGPQNGYTYWGSNINGMNHALGTTGQTFADSSSSNFFVTVSSWVNSPTSVTFCIDFSNYGPGQYSLHAFEIIGLKNDHTLVGVTATQGTAIIQDGNKVRWDGTGQGLVGDPLVYLKIEQSPAPGAVALFGLAGLTARGRRRAR